MGRMTYQHCGKWCIDGKKIVSDTQANCWGAAADLLAAYENTGLSPEQIQKAVDLLNEYEKLGTVEELTELKFRMEGLEK